MMKVKAFKINVETRAIEEIEIGSLGDFYEAIGNNCSLIEVGFRLAHNDVIMVDEEGLYHDCIGGFGFLDKDGWPEKILIGNGVVIGTDDEGEDVEPIITKNFLEQKIKFLPLELAEKVKQIMLNEPIRIIEL